MWRMYIICCAAIANLQGEYPRKRQQLGVHPGTLRHLAQPSGIALSHALGLAFQPLCPACSCVAFAQARRRRKRSGGCHRPLERRRQLRIGGHMHYACAGLYATLLHNTLFHCTLHHTPLRILPLLHTLLGCCCSWLFAKLSGTTSLAGARGCQRVNPNSCMRCPI